MLCSGRETDQQTDQLCHPSCGHSSYAFFCERETTAGSNAYFGRDVEAAKFCVVQGGEQARQPAGGVLLAEAFRCALPPSDLVDESLSEAAERQIRDTAVPIAVLNVADSAFGKLAHLDIQKQSQGRPFACEVCHLTQA